MGPYGSGPDPGGLLALNLKTGAVRNSGEAQGLKNTKSAASSPWIMKAAMWVATYAGLVSKLAGSPDRFEQLTPPGTDAGEMFHTIDDRSRRQQ